MSAGSTSSDAMQRALDREKRSRRAAEELLETKSSELYESNRRLSEAREALEAKVIERTMALKEARDDAVRLMEERTVFLARISHELRTPLNSILGVVQLLLQEESRVSQRRKLETVNASSNVLLTMINELLDFTKIEAGEASVELLPTDVAAIVDDAVDMLTQTAAEKGVALYVQKRAGLPAQVVTDPSRLTQIVLNLLSNAVKFTNDGSVTVNLDVVGSAEPELVLSVIDTGVGVHPERLDKIFQPFKQSVEGKQAHSGGTGLGLSIVKQSASLLGGAVSLDSVLGEGSTFVVRLPVRLPDEEQQAAEQVELAGTALSDQTARQGQDFDKEEDKEDDAENAPEAGAQPSTEQLGDFKNMGRSAPLRILVADDNETNRTVVEMQLSYLGLSADYVANGEEVVRAVLAHRYDVILMDISMPLMDGEEACRAIRNMTGIEQPQIVAVTASALSGDRERYLAGGMDYYLPKPVDSLLLAQLLRDITVSLPRSSSAIPDNAAAQGSTERGMSETHEDDREFASEGLIDLDEMRARLGDMLEPMLLRVSPIFIAEMPQRLERLERTWRTGSRDELAATLHSLKGSAASAGAVQMAELFGDNEVQIRLGGDLGQETLESLIRCARATAVELERIVVQLES